MTEDHNWYAKYRREVEQAYGVARGLDWLAREREAQRVREEFARAFGLWRTP